MTQENLEEVQGKCPVCSGQLELEGSELVCSLEKDHFKIQSIIFEKAWARFEEAIKVYPSIDEAQSEAIELLETLLRNNLAPEKPTMKTVLGE